MDWERLQTYFNSIQPDMPEYLLEIEKDALANDVPIIRKDTQYYLRTLLKQVKPKRILEVGTAVGFSALLMREFSSEASITTIENYPPRIDEAKKNFLNHDLTKSITLLEGDAEKILPTLEGEYDLVFMDAAKGQYMTYLPDLLRLTKPGALILTDNVLQEGDILESHYAVRRRDRTIHKRMREYLYELCNTNELSTTIMPIGDGLSYSVRL